MPKYLIVIQTQCQKTPEDTLRRMVKDCFEVDCELKFREFAQVRGVNYPLPLYEVLVDSDEPPFGKLPTYVRRLARA